MNGNPRTLARYSAVVLASVLLTPSSQLHAQEQALADQENWSATQQEVWEQEQAYWRLLPAGDVEGFMTLWDEQFVGWPGGDDQPIGRAEIRSMVEEVPKASDLRYDADLQPLAVNVYGNIGITFYRVIYVNEKGEATGAGRLTHTWRKQDGEWKIIGGMSAPATDTASWKR